MTDKEPAQDPECLLFSSEHRNNLLLLPLRLPDNEAVLHCVLALIFCTDTSGNLVKLLSSGVRWS